MKILENELKKIFNFKSILVVLLINFIIYFLFIEFEIKFFPNGRPEKDAYRISVKMINEKGNNLKDDDITYLYTMKDNMLKEANTYLENNEKAKKLNIKDYIQLREERSQKKGAREEAIEDLNSDIMFKEGVNVFWELQVINDYIEDFEHKENIFKSLQKEERYKDRVEIIRKNKSQNSILPWFVFYNYNNIIKYSSIAMIMSLVFMIGPIFTKDTRNSIELLQYTTKRGRNLYKDKVKAAIIASPIIITLQLGVIFFLYITRTYSVSMFYNSNINSCFLGRLFWFDITFLQYILLTIVLFYITGIIVTLITCYVSRSTSNYIALIGLLLPISLLLIYLTKSIILDTVGNIFFFKYKIPIIIAVLILISIILIVIRYGKEKKIDIVL